MNRSLVERLSEEEQDKVDVPSGGDKTGRRATVSKPWAGSSSYARCSRPAKRSGSASSKRSIRPRRRQAVEPANKSRQVLQHPLTVVTSRCRILLFGGHRLEADGKACDRFSQMRDALGIQLCDIEIRRVINQATVASAKCDILRDPHIDAAAITKAASTCRVAPVEVANCDGLNKTAPAPPET